MIEELRKLSARAGDLHLLWGILLGNVSTGTCAAGFGCANPGHFTAKALVDGLANASATELVELLPELPPWFLFDSAEFSGFQDELGRLLRDILQCTRRLKNGTVFSRAEIEAEELENFADRPESAPYRSATEYCKMLKPIQDLRESALAQSA